MSDDIPKQDAPSEREGSFDVRHGSGQVASSGQALPDKGEERAERLSRARRAGVRGIRAGRAERAVKQHRPNPIARLVNRWFDRVMGAVKEGGLSNQHAEYAAHRTTRDFVWNTVGATSWSLVFPVVTMVSTQLVGVEQAGMISMAFMVGLLLTFLANFGVRTYQVSDVSETHSFNDYQINRWITCLLMVAVGYAYCVVRGYDAVMFGISMGVFLYRMIDGLADVYEGRLQQVDKLYLAGISQALRSLSSLAAFAIALLITRNAVIASFAMALAAAFTFVVVTYPLALLETPRSRKAAFSSIFVLFKNTFPLFLALFLFNLIESMPKFVMEGALSYDNQLYYNALYFPAQGILIAAQLVYKPLLVRMAGVWRDESKRRRFDLILVGILALVVGITAAMLAVMAWVGVPLLNVLYGVDFEEFRGLLYIMLVSGGVTAAIDFLYQVITVMRRQKDVTTLYLVTFGFSVFIPVLLVSFTGLPGAVLSYLIVMSILLVLLVWEYFRIRRDLSRGRRAEVVAEAGRRHRTTFSADGDGVDGSASRGDEGAGEVEGRPSRLVRPSEERVRRRYREEVMGRRTNRRS